MMAYVTHTFLLFSLTACWAYVVDDSPGLGRTFDGIGGLSGGGATSKLLVNYPEKQRNEILNYLFKPNFAASLQILKVEIGGDAQSTDGTESSHMHTADDENYHRGYEWWLMKEAKARNPAIKLYGLPWAWPGWIGGKSGNPYANPNATASYIVKWVLGAKKYHGLDLDYIGIWNERQYNDTYITTLRSQLNQNGLQHIKMVAADGGWDLAEDILKYPQVRDAVDIIGVHYPGTTTTSDAVKTNKVLWSSEDYSTFNDNVGAGCWARILNQNYVNGNMTSTISWNLIAAYYMDFPFGRDGLMTSMEPWSGHYVVESPIWVTAHTTQFAGVGWQYLQHGAGVGKLDNGGSYVSLLSPDKQHFTIVIETMSHDHSICIRPSLPAYNTTKQTATFQLKGSLAKISTLNVWMSKLGFDGAETTLMKKAGQVKVNNGSFSVTLDIDTIMTLTTSDGGQKGEYDSPPDSQPFPVPYKDNYEGYPEYSEAYNFPPQVGVFEVRDTHDVGHGMANVQVVPDVPVYWCSSPTPRPIVVGGNYNWTDVTMSVEAYVPIGSTANGTFIAIRIEHGGCEAGSANGVFFFLDALNQKYYLSTDILRTKIVTAGNFPAKHNTWFTMKIKSQGDQIHGFIDGQLVVSYTGSTPTKHGFVGYGTDGYGEAWFDNFQISSAEINVK